MLSVGGMAADRVGVGTHRTVGNGPGSRRRWVANASARESHDADLLIAVIHGW